MLILVAQYAVMFSLFLSKENLQRQMEADDQSIYLRAACTARCVQYQRQQRKLTISPLQGCFDSCHSLNSSFNTNTTDKLTKIHENLSSNLICRDDRSLTMRIDLERLSAPGIYENITNTNDTISMTRTIDNTNYLRENIYLIKIHAYNETKTYSLYMSDDNIFTFDALTQNTTYNFTIVAVHASNEFSVIAKGQQYATLRRGFTPGMVTDIKVQNFVIEQTNNMRLRATIEWRPSADMTCHYNIICFSPENEDYDLTPLEIRNPRQLYSHHLENLTFSSVYKVGIRSKNPNNVSKESELFWKTFESPTCVDWYKYNFNVCAPIKPESLVVEQTSVGGYEFSLNISWKQPQHFPDYYTIRILDLTENGSSYIMNVSKELHTLIIPKIILRGVVFEIHLTAYTPGGNSTAVVTDFTKLFVVLPDKNHIVKLTSAILVPIFCVVILSLTSFTIFHRRAKLKRYQERCKYFEELENIAPIDPKATLDFSTKNIPLLPYPEDLTQFQLDLEEKIIFNDSMEIERNAITLYEVLGEGAFGLVRRGIYKDEKLGTTHEVAVKMLKDQPNADDVRAFRREIEVMKSVEKHPNIVGIIGHCTQRCNEIMLLTEYCSFGNLLDFLREEWRYLHEGSSHKEFITKSSPYKQLKIERPRRTQEGKQHRQQQYNNNNNNSVFNFDTTLLEKIKLKYKNLNTSQQQQQQSVKQLTPTHNPDNADVTAAPNQLLSPATDNKSYGYDEFCTNSCKCQVDVLIKNLDSSSAKQEADQLEYMLQQKMDNSEISATNIPAAIATISIKNCECKRQQQLLAKSNHRNITYSVITTQSAPSTPPTPSPPPPPPPLASSVENKAYFKSLLDTPPKSTAKLRQSKMSLAETIEREPLGAADLLDIAKQVAVGMEFLAKNKVVHRDLAARNVLVAPDRTIKIADFGLSRDIYQENIYKKTGNGKLPIKWLALESMTHAVYSTQSDVWSFGILLYEIVTLGGTPYPSIPTNRLLHLLKTGYRMEKPRNCGQEFYNLMNSCWSVIPAERPTFTEIIKILQNLMDDGQQLQVERSVPIASNVEKITESTSDDSYLMPK